jgi:hypothetical protein
MHVRRSYLGLGILLILAGAVPLAARAGYISAEQLDRVWQLWPLILVGIGVGLVLSRTRFALVGGLIVAATFGLMIGGFLGGSFASVTGGFCGSTSENVAFPGHEGTINVGGTVAIELDCGALELGTGSGDGWRVEGRSKDGIGPEIASSETSLQVKSAHSGSGPFWLDTGRDTWMVTIPESPRLDLDVDMNAGQATIDLGAATLGSIVLEANAGSSVLDLGSVSAIATIDLRANAGSLGVTLPNHSMTGSIEANAGAVRICAPAGAGLRLKTGQSFISSYDYAAHGLVQDGSTWTTPGFERATVRIDLETVANAGSFTLDPEDGCG